LIKQLSLIQGFSGSMLTLHLFRFGNSKPKFRHTYVLLFPWFILNPFRSYLTFKMGRLEPCLAHPPRKFKTKLSSFTCVSFVLICAEILSKEYNFQSWRMKFTPVISLCKNNLCSCVSNDNCSHNYFFYLVYSHKLFGFP
jgi:hypothetical protein